MKLFKFISHFYIQNIVTAIFRLVLILIQKNFAAI